MRGSRAEALRVTLGFALLGGLWILFSDRAADAIASGDPELLTYLQTYKGWLFVGLVALLLYAETRRREREVERGRRLTEALLETGVALIVVLDREGKILRFNEACQATTGHAEDAVCGRSYARTLFPPEDHAEVERALAETLRGGTRSVLEGTWLTASRHRRRVAWTVSPVPHAQGGPEALVVAGLDITERQRLEQQLRQAQKLEAIGRLAGGVAHDFNNILGAIEGHAELLLRNLGSSDPGAHRVEHIRKAVGRAAGLSRQLLAFARKETSQPRLVDLNDVVTGVESMLRRLIREDIQLVTLFNSAAAPLMADPGQIEQVILNLAVNARDAMPEGGRLLIETGLVAVGEPAEASGLRPGSYVLLAVGDTGVGMDEEVRAHLFEPFFTTKDPEKGTGLGLSTVYGIVEQHGGHIEVESTPGRGSTFRIYLPRAEPEMVSRTAPRAVAPPPGGTETILLVEDEEGFRLIVRELIEQAGYTVLDAGSAERALALVQEHAGPLQLLLTDVVLPRMSGREVANRAREARPDLKVLYMSGHTEKVIRASETAYFLQKPFDSSTLLSKIRECLDGPRERS